MKEVFKFKRCRSIFKSANTNLNIFSLFCGSGAISGEDLSELVADEGGDRAVAVGRADEQRVAVSRPAEKIICHEMHDYWFIVLNLKDL